MKFSTILAFASLAFAAPAPINQRGDVTVVGTIVQLSGDLQAAITTNAGAIGKLVHINMSTNITNDSTAQAATEIAGNVTAEIEAQIEAKLAANLADILAAIAAASKTVLTVTVSVTGKIILGVTVLAQAEIDNLTAAVKIIASVLVKLQATLTVTIGNLGPATQAFLSAEIIAIKAVLSPFIGPFLIYVDAVVKNSASVGVTLDALVEAQAELIVVVKSITASLGLPAIST